MTKQPSTSDANAASTMCRFDPGETRAWLTADHPNRPCTNADALRIGDDFDINGFDKWVRITNLLGAAQAANVFGLDHALVGVLHLAGEHGFVNAHRITLTTPGEPVLCSAELDTLDLLTDHLVGVDAAVHLLAAAAQTADTLVQQRAQLLQAQPAPAPEPGRPGPPRAFRPPAAQTYPPPAPPSQPPASPTVPGRHR